MRPKLVTWRSVRVSSYVAMLYLGLLAGTYTRTRPAVPRGCRANDSRRQSSRSSCRPCSERVSHSWWVGGPRFVESRDGSSPGKEGGAVSYGALVSVPLSVPLLVVLGLPIAAFWDAGALGFLTAIACLRIGCFLNGCCCGLVARRIPTQLLEAGMGRCSAGRRDTGRGQDAVCGRALPVHPRRLCGGPLPPRFRSRRAAQARQAHGRSGVLREFRTAFGDAPRSPYGGDRAMNALLLAAPLIVFVIVVLFGFAGCSLDKEGIPGRSPKNRGNGPDGNGPDVRPSRPLRGRGQGARIRSRTGASRIPNQAIPSKDEIGAPPLGDHRDLSRHVARPFARPERQRPQATPARFDGTGFVDVPHAAPSRC